MKVKNKFLIISLLVSGVLIASDSSQVVGKVKYEGKAPRVEGWYGYNWYVVQRHT